jgi:cation diffusion facilitator family transporter
MFTAALQLIIEASKRIIIGDKGIKLDAITVGMLVGTIIIKALLFIYCNYFTKGSPSTEALAQDHRNDVVSNTAAIISAVIGFYYWWAADPIGAIAIGLLIMFTWVKTGFEHIRMMTGYRASPNLMKKWTFVSLQHDSRIVCIENIRGYHLSHGFIVEIDIVLPKAMPLNEAHDIGETLQEKLEALPEVERAFVHCDYEATHKPEH